MRICIVSITVLFSVPMVAASYAVAATTVTNDVIFTNPARSIHWKTVCSGNLEIPVPNWPDGASSATLSVSGNDFAAKTFTISSPEDSFRLTLALPDTEKTETMLTFTLTYATETGEILAGEPHSATLGFVRGVGNGATVKCVPGDVRVATMSNWGLGPVMPYSLARFEMNPYAHGVALADMAIAYLSGRLPQGRRLVPLRYIGGDSFPL